MSDIAGCLADVLKCTAGDTSAAHMEGKRYLHILLRQLSNIRGKESHYLRPLMAKMEGLVGFDINQSLPMPILETVTQPTLASMNGTNGIPLGAPGGFPMSMGRLSVSQNGMDMLRSLSLSGPLVLPDAGVGSSGVEAGDGGWGRRPSGRVYDEEETSWMMDDRGS